MTEQPRVCILGGGFGGLYTALALERLPWDGTEKPLVTLVDQRDRFIFLPMLYEMVTGELQTWEIAPPYEELLAPTDIRFLQKSVSTIDVDANVVNLGDGSSIAYDYLVLAMGGETPLDTVPGAKDYAIPFHDVSHAYRLQEKLRQLEQSDRDKIRVAIAGGGYSGVELACKLADRLGERGRIRIIDRGSDILTNSTDFNREAAKRALDDRGVWLDFDTEVTEVGAETISLKYEDQVDTIPAELVLWTVGTRVASAIQALTLPKTDGDRLEVTATLQVTDHPHLFALGDLAACIDASGERVPTTAQSAVQAADYVAWNIWALTTGKRPLLEFKYQHLGEMMTLGVDEATLTGLGLTLDGSIAHVARRLAYLYRMPTLDHQIKVGLNWMTQPLRDWLTP